MKLVNSKTLAIGLALGLTFTLASCASAEDTDNPSSTATPSATSTPGSEVITGNSDDTETQPSELVQTVEAPDWAASVLTPLSGKWFFLSKTDQAMAVLPAFDVPALEAFVEAKIKDGWSFDVQPVKDDLSYVATLYRGSDGEYLTVVGTSADAPGAEETGAASSVIYNK